jgi:hypothetical protein
MNPPKEFESKLKELAIKPTKHLLVVNIADQSMTLFEGKESIKTYTVSTSERGIGQLENTMQTPLGLHRISNKIGDKAAICAIFKSREDTGEICPPGSLEHKGEDLILTRILRLEGLEEGFNRGKDGQGRVVDSFQRYVYIHGTNHEEQLGTPASHGCVRMGNLDVLDLFSRVAEGTLVWISES